jgi:hypothetical protein
MGHWKPAGPGGQKSLAFVHFNPGRIWSGSDGCNSANGSWTLGAGGQLSATLGPSTLIGCENWAGPSWVGQAARAAIEGPKLILFDQSGKQLGVMVREGSKPS